MRLGRADNESFAVFCALLIILHQLHPSSKSTQEYLHIQSLFVPHYYLKQIQALGMSMNLHSNTISAQTIPDITGTGTLPQI